MAKRCLNDTCTKHPSFGTEGSRLSLYCKRHAQNGMVYVRHTKRCLHYSCMKQPRYNIEASKTAVYCKQHSQDGMVDVYSKRCLHDSCMTRPSFCIDGSKTAVYCKQHFQESMVDVHCRRCARDSCAGKATFFVAATETTGYCKDHAEDGMLNFLKKPTLEGVRTSGSARVVPPKAADTPRTTRREHVCLDGATKSYSSSPDVVHSRKRSMVELDRVHPPFCAVSYTHLTLPTILRV